MPMMISAYLKAEEVDLGEDPSFYGRQVLYGVTRLKTRPRSWGVQEEARLDRKDIEDQGLYCPNDE